ncbi:hypothetical protein TNCV_3837581 [Trichonephila clavipes]|nr:hypothetical protein TNCV_3837581 [Trichonephila clavipes]
MMDSKSADSDFRPLMDCRVAGLIYTRSYRAQSLPLGVAQMRNAHSDVVLVIWLLFKVKNHEMASIETDRGFRRFFARRFRPRTAWEDNYKFQLTAVPQGFGSNSGEGLDVCKYIVPLRHGVTLNNHRAASPLVRLVEGEERWKAPSSFPQCSPSTSGWNRAKSYYNMYRAQGYGQRQAYI